MGLHGDFSHEGVDELHAHMLERRGVDGGYFAGSAVAVAGGRVASVFMHVHGLALSVVEVGCGCRCCQAVRMYRGVKRVQKRNVANRRESCNN